MSQENSDRESEDLDSLELQDLFEHLANMGDEDAINRLVSELGAQIKTNNLNNYQAITGLKYFIAPNVSQHPDYPHLSFEPNADRWLKQIEALTPIDNNLWNLEGRI